MLKQPQQCSFFIMYHGRVWTAAAYLSIEWTGFIGSLTRNCRRSLVFSLSMRVCLKWNACWHLKTRKSCVHGCICVHVYAFCDFFNWYIFMNVWYSAFQHSDKWVRNHCSWDDHEFVPRTSYRCVRKAVGEFIDWFPWDLLAQPEAYAREAGIGRDREVEVGKIIVRRARQDCDGNKML